MKNYEEMAESVLERRDRYEAERKRQMKRTVTGVSCFCVVALLGTGIWYTGTMGNGSQMPGMQPADEGFVSTGVADERPAGGILPGGATVGVIDNSADTKKEMQQPAKEDMGEEYDGDSAGYPAQTMDMPQQDGEISETDPLDTGTAIDMPTVENAGNTGALTAYEAVWGGSYPNEAGQWVVWLTENTAENQNKVFELNPSLTEDNTIFKTAAYSLTYLKSLMESISQATESNGELSFVSSVGLREEKNCVQVCVTTDDPESIAKVLAFDTLGGAVEIINLNDFVVPEETQKGPQP